MTKNIERLQQYMDKHFKKSKKSILSIGYVRGENKYIKEVNCNKEHKDVALFGLGSVTKTFISTYVAHMIHSKKIDGNQPISSYLPLKGKFAYPTIMELATHSSGYPCFIPRWPSIPILLFLGFNRMNIYKGVKHQWVYHYLNKYKPKAKRYRYSDFNYSVLALIIERTENKPFKEVLNDFIQNEIGLKNTKYYDYETSKKDMFSWNWEDENPFIAAGGLYSTMDDMLNFLIYQNDCKNTYLDLAHSKIVRMNRNNVYMGFSWSTFESGDSCWHIGGQGKYRSYVLFNKKRQMGIAILSTVDIDLQHVSRLGSSIYKSVKRNDKAFIEYLESYQAI